MVRFVIKKGLGFTAETQRTQRRDFSLLPVRPQINRRSSSAGKEHPFTSASNAFARHAINSVEMAVGLRSGIFLAL